MEPDAGRAAYPSWPERRSAPRSGTVGRWASARSSSIPCTMSSRGRADARAALDEPGCLRGTPWSQTLGGTRGVIETSAPGLIFVIVYVATHALVPTPRRGPPPSQSSPASFDWIQSVRALNRPLVFFGVAVDLVSRDRAWRTILRGGSSRTRHGRGLSPCQSSRGVPGRLFYAMLTGLPAGWQHLSCAPAAVAPCSRGCGRVYRPAGRRPGPPVGRWRGRGTGTLLALGLPLALGANRGLRITPRPPSPLPRTGTLRPAQLIQRADASESGTSSNSSSETSNTSSWRWSADAHRAVAQPGRSAGQPRSAAPADHGRILGKNQRWTQQRYRTKRDALMPMETASSTRAVMIAAATPIRRHPFGSKATVIRLTVRRHAGRRILFWIAAKSPEPALSSPVAAATTSASSHAALTQSIRRASVRSYPVRARDGRDAQLLRHVVDECGCRGRAPAAPGRRCGPTVLGSLR